MCFRTTNSDLGVTDLKKVYFGKQERLRTHNQWYKESGKTQERKRERKYNHIQLQKQFNFSRLIQFLTKTVRLVDVTLDGIFGHAKIKRDRDGRCPRRKTGEPLLDVFVRGSRKLTLDNRLLPSARGIRVEEGSKL